LGGRTVSNGLRFFHFNFILPKLALNLMKIQSRTIILPNSVPCIHKEVRAKQFVWCRLKGGTFLFYLMHWADKITIDSHESSYSFKSSFTNCANEKEEHWGAITYSSERETEVSKMFIISLGNWNKQESTPWRQTVPSLEYGLPNQPIIAHMVPERYNKTL